MEGAEARGVFWPLGAARHVELSSTRTSLISFIRRPGLLAQNPSGNPDLEGRN